jgi:hypothetical protein
VTHFHSIPRPAKTDTQTELNPDMKADPTNLHELPLHVPTLTNSPRCAPATRPTKPTTPTTPRRVRTVRVDAWAVPASVNWSRARTAVRKVNRSARSTDWALPF